MFTARLQVRDVLLDEALKPGKATLQVADLCLFLIRSSFSRCGS